jgi:Ca2+-binding RTX toxin-like protein
MPRRSMTVSLVVALVAVTGLVVAQPALATVTSTVVDGVLTVTGDETVDSARIKCSNDDEVRINGETPDSGVFACSALTGIVVNTLDGDDRVDLTEVGPDQFPLVTSVLVRGGDGNDVIVGSELDDELRGEGGNDDLSPEGGATNVVDGGPGDDEIIELRAEKAVATQTTLTAAGSSTISRIEGMRLAGTKKPNTLDTKKFNGRVELTGNAGNDTLLAGAGYSNLVGGDGKDSLSGGDGGDVLFGGSGADELLGKGGPDRIDGGTGSDKCVGGPGVDELRNCD